MTDKPWFEQVHARQPAGAIRINQPTAEYPRDTLVAYLHGTDVSASFQQSLADLFLSDITLGGPIRDAVFARCATGGVPDGRNQAVAYWLNGDCEWMFMVDSDMGFPRDIIKELRLVADPVERPIVGGLCFAQREIQPDGANGFRTEPRPTMYDFVEYDDGLHRYRPHATYPINALVKCDATGAACVLIHRSVVEKLWEKWGPTWFDRYAAEDGALMGEDISFYDRCRRAGIPLHVFTGAKTTHHKPIWLAEADYWRSFTPPPATERVDVIVPVLHRPQNVKPFIESLRASTGLATAWFVVDPDDEEEIDAVVGAGGFVVEHPGSFAQKANVGYRRSRELSVATSPWIFLAGDDVVFRPGWLDHAQFVAGRYNASVVGTNDLGNKAVLSGEHATHMLIRRSYIDEVGADFHGTPGTACSEEYRHWFVDNEIVLAAKRRGVWQMAIGSIVEHMHPIFGKGEQDEVYELGQSFAEQDRATFLRRCEETRAA